MQSRAAEAEGTVLADVSEQAALAMTSVVTGTAPHMQDQHHLQQGLQVDQQSAAVLRQHPPAVATQLQAQHQQPAQLQPQSALQGHPQHALNLQQQAEDSDQDASPSEASECQSEVAVGDDELLDTDPDPPAAHHSLAGHISTTQHAVRATPDDDRYVIRSEGTGVLPSVQDSAQHVQESCMLHQGAQQQQRQQQMRERQPELQQQRSRLTLSAHQRGNNVMRHLPVPHSRTEEHTVSQPSRLKAAYRGQTIAGLNLFMPQAAAGL